MTPQASIDVDLLAPNNNTTTSTTQGYHHSTHDSKSPPFQNQDLQPQDQNKMMMLMMASACQSSLSSSSSLPEVPANIMVLESSSFIVPQLLISAVIITGFICTKTFLDNFRKRHARISVVIVGSGPTGLTSLMVAARCERVSKIYVYEEMTRQALMAKPYQMAFDVRSVHFLKKLGVDFDNIEGCWDCGCFFTRVSVFQEYVLSTVHRLRIPVDVHLGTKFSKDILRETDRLSGRKLVIVCDGSNGSSTRTLSLSDEFVQQPCKAYGAVAALERPEECVVPMPERRVHNLHFDLTAYGTDGCDLDGYKGFSFKIFGTSRHRLMCLIIPKSESPLIKCLRTVLDRSLMRNIFLKCFNTYKPDGQSRLSEPMALKHLKFSPRLFEVKLSQRVETTAFFPNTDMFVCVEGDAARCYNIHTGMDVNIGIRGLMSLSNFISTITIAETDHIIEKCLLQKSKEGEKICKELVNNGLWDYTQSAYRKMS